MADFVMPRFGHLRHIVATNTGELCVCVLFFFRGEERVERSLLCVVCCVCVVLCLCCVVLCVFRLCSVVVFPDGVCVCRLRGTCTPFLCKRFYFFGLFIFHPSCRSFKKRLWVESVMTIHPIPPS